MKNQITAETFIRDKAFPLGITNEDWTKFKHNHQGKQWVGFAIKAMEEYTIEFVNWMRGKYEPVIYRDENRWATRHVANCGSANKKDYFTTAELLKKFLKEPK